MKAGLRIGLALPVAGAALSVALAGCGGSREEEAGEPEPGTAPGAPEPQQEPAAREPRQEAEAGGETAPPAGGNGGGRPLVTEVPGMEATVTTLQYTNESSKPDQTCSNCQFYTPGGGGLGRCQLFTEGFVKEGGWCQSWAEKQT